MFMQRSVNLRSKKIKQFINKLTNQNKVIQ